MIEILDNNDKCILQWCSTQIFLTNYMVHPVSACNSHIALHHYNFVHVDSHPSRANRVELMQTVNRLFIIAENVVYHKIDRLKQYVNFIDFDIPLN